MENIKQLAMRVQELRAQKNFTVPQMAELLGVTPEEYQSYEDGSKQAPFSFYYNLAEHFGLDVSSVISGEAPNLAVYTVTRDGKGFPFVRRPGFSYLHQAIRMKERLHTDGANLIQNNEEAAGQTVPHFHLQVIPRYKNDGQHMLWKPGKASDEELDAIVKEME